MEWSALGGRFSNPNPDLKPLFPTLCTTAKEEHPANSKKNVAHRESKLKSQNPRVQGLSSSGV